MTKICVPVCARDVDEMREATERAAKVCDLIELRLDYLKAPQPIGIWPEIRRLVNGRRETFIVTMRPQHQGGKAHLTLDERLRFWSLAGNIPSNVLVDLELDIVNALLTSGAFSVAQVICSHHELDSGVVNLHDLYSRMAKTGAGILKIATCVSDAVDCLSIFRLLRRAQNEGRELIAIGMGEAGVVTRILGPSLRSFLTYGSLGGDKATAPGQLSVSELREVYRIDSIDSQTEIMGVVGNPVGHSLSPAVHNAAFAAAGLNAVYIPFNVCDVGAFIRRMVQKRSREIDWNLRGLSVTAPHKLAVMKRLDWIEPAARQMRAVNTIVLNRDGLQGYNTDAAAFIEPLRRAFGPLTNARCAVIGGGGAARAALWALRNDRAQVTLFVRDPARAEFFAQQFNAECKLLQNAHFNKFDIVINATPLGMRGNQENEASATANQLRGVRLVYDLVYNPLETQFMRNARQAGCQTVGGLEMLIAQAVEQFRLWTGQTSDANAMRAAAERALQAL